MEKREGEYSDTDKAKMQLSGETIEGFHITGKTPEIHSQNS